LHTTEPSPRGRLDATTAACLVFLARQESLERTANQANLVSQVPQAFLVVLHWKFARKCHRHRASHAHQDHPDHPVHLASPAPPAHKATLAAPAKTAEMAHPAHLAHQDLLDNQAKTERKDHRVPQLSAFQRPLVTKDHPARLVHLALLAFLVLLALMALPAPLATKARLVQPDHQATMVPQATKDRQAQMDQRASRVFAPNIAPPTAVFSSKMVQGDKRFQRALRRVCYIDEKPVIFMSIVFFIISLTFNGQFSHSQPTILNTAAASPVISFGAF